jgi:hypothetical protein
MEVVMRNIRDIITIISIVSVMLIVSATPGWTRSAPDNTIYAGLLKSYVIDGRVDYTGFKNDERLLDNYLRQLAAADPDALERSDQMALYINAYNAWTIKLILTRYPDVGSIKELGSIFQSPWKKKFVKLNGKTVSLDYIEHAILRPVFKDPRVHFAVNCASIGCPPLMAEPYNGKDLENQLNGMARAFINDPKNNYLEDDTLYVSKIFKWFGEDFGNDILGFIKSYAEGDLARKLKARPEPKIEYLDYDWSLNKV